MSMIGKSLAHYEITAEIGKGGMGEVYQAKDQKLGRNVAIKVLPEEFARDADRVARFQREAKLLASLNHPNIAAIHGLEETGGIHFLVMELIEGNTLSDRIKVGPIPVEETLKLALQIAEALEAAHEKGVIHRDLKPANIKVTLDGKVKVLDFGLAKAYAGDPDNINLSDSPTLSDAATQQGVILGTAAYMPPEQAKGKTVDKRADIWAFGVVLFEMLTGRRAFTGESVSETLASVIKSEPEWKSLPPNLHPRIRLMLERCLDKDPKNRYSSISDARVDIQKVLADPSGVFSQPSVLTKPAKTLRGSIPWVAAAIVIIAVIIGGAVWILKPTPQPQVVRLDYDLPDGQRFNVSGLINLGHTLAVSPDGSQFIYSTGGGLYLRSMNELKARLIPGTDDDNPQSPFFSPDGQSVGYWSRPDKKLKKIDIRGGAPAVLCDVNWIFGAIWYPDNTIVYADIPSDIKRVSANGGTPEILVKGPCVAPQLLSDGKSVIFTDISSDPYKIVVQSLESEERTVLFPGIAARYLPTGHLVYGWESNLYAVQFNPDTFKVTGGQVPIVTGVEMFWDISGSGTLVYVPGTTGTSGDAAAPQHTLVWVDREGNEEPLGVPPNSYISPSISHDGKRIALLTENPSDIWICDFDRKIPSNLTHDKSEEWQPLWTPDDKRIIYYSDYEGGVGGIYSRAYDGSGKVEKLGSVSDRLLLPWSITRDGKFLLLNEVPLLNEIPSLTNTDIGMLSLEGDHEHKLLLQNEFLETYAKISPDGQWMAYLSNEGGTSELYIRSFPDVEVKRELVSSGFANCPLWSPDGKELFYLGGGSVMAVTVRTEPTFKLGTPEKLFQYKYLPWSINRGMIWDIHPDGDKFLMIKPPERTDDEAAPPPPPKIIVVTNWFEELKEKVPVP